MELLVVAAPVVATMTSYTIMQFADQLMVSRMGPDPVYVGAQGNGGLLSFVPISIATGFITVVNTYVSQNLGAGKPERGPAYAWAAVWFSAAFWALILLPFAALVPWVVGLMRDTGLDEAALASADRRDAMAVEYARILLIGAIVTMTTRAISQYFYGMHKPMVVLVGTVAGNIVNLVGNSFLIYGPTAAKTGVGWLDAWFEFTASLCASLGIPRLGVAGAAYATVLGSLVELLIPALLFLSPRFERLYRTRSAWKPSLGHYKDLVRIGWPGAIMFGNEMICWAFFMVYLVGQFGPMHSTAGWIAHRYMSLSFMPTVGISVAMTAMVGKCMGMKRPDLAEARAWLGLKVAATYMTLCGIAFVIFREPMVRAFIDSATPPDQAAELIKYGSLFLLAVAAFQFFDGVAMSLNGALRGAGDTRWPGVFTVVLSWLIIVLGGLAMVRYAPGLESLGPWIAAAVYIVALAAALFTRFRMGAWRRIELVKADQDRPRNRGDGPAGGASQPAVTDTAPTPV